jgi:probable F420-dependent oxidoreductase
VRVSLGVPACREGTTYSPGFVDPALLVEVAQRAEECDYDALMSNDVTSTPSRIREVFKEPPSFFEPLITFTYLSAKTSRIRFTTGVLPVPIRADDVVLLARQAATLDQLSGGRLTLGLGRGGWEDEWKQTHPDARGVHRGEMTLEAVAALRVLFAERRATHRGRHYHFEDVETHPKPVQNPLPIWLAGRTPETFERIGRVGDGWLNSGIGADDVRRARERISAAALAAGRDPARISICALYWVAMGKNHAEAQAVAEASAEALRFGRLDQPTQVIGTPDEIRSRFAPLAAAGCDELSVVLQARDRAELLGLIDLFASRVAAPLRA